MKDSRRFLKTFPLTLSTVTLLSALLTQPGPGAIPSPAKPEGIWSIGI